MAATFRNFSQKDFKPEHVLWIWPMLYLSKKLEGIWDMVSMDLLLWLYCLKYTMFLLFQDADGDSASQDLAVQGITIYKLKAGNFPKGLLRACWVDTPWVLPIPRNSGTRLKSSRNSSLSWIVQGCPQKWTASRISCWLKKMDLYRMKANCKISIKTVTLLSSRLY